MGELRAEGEAEPRRTRQDRTATCRAPASAAGTRVVGALGASARHGTEHRSRRIDRHLRRRGPTAGSTSPARKPAAAATSRRRRSGAYQPCVLERSAAFADLRNFRNLSAAPYTVGTSRRGYPVSLWRRTSARIDSACSARAAPGRASFVAASLGARGACYRARAEATRSVA